MRRTSTSCGASSPPPSSALRLRDGLSLPRLYAPPMAMTLPKEACLALAALGWADGSIRKSERAGLGRAAKECGMTGDDLAAVEEALAKETKLDDFVPGDMTEWQRVLTYALGV